MLLFALNGHLFVDFRAEAGHEGLKDYANHNECVENSIHDLVCSCLVRLNQNPRLILLEVKVAIRAHFHSDAETILHFGRLHKFNVFGEFSEETIHKVHISIMLLTFGVGGNGFLIGASQELKDSVTEVTEVGEELVIVLSNEVRPQEYCVLVLRPVNEQVVSPDLAGNTCIHGIITEDTNVSCLREFLGLTSLRVNFIVQKFSSTDSVKFGPWLLSSDKS